MDSKKFMQMVQEKAKKVMEEKEAPLKWEQRLEAALKAEAEAKAKSNAIGRKHRRRSSSSSDSESDSDGGERRVSRRGHKKHKGHHHRRHKHHDSSDSEYSKVEREGKLRKRTGSKSCKHHRQSGSSDLDSLSDKEGISTWRNRARRLNRHRKSDYRSSDLSIGEDRVTRSRGHKRCCYKRRHQFECSSSGSSRDEGSPIRPSCSHSVPDQQQETLKSSQKAL